MYQHRQKVSALLLLLIAVCSVLPLALLLLVPPEPAVVVGRFIAVLAVLIVLSCAVVFGSMTVSIEAGALTWWFGPGLFRRSVQLSRIVHVGRTRTSPGEGWGIHRTQRGWLYNVSGTAAVCIQLSDGEQFLLGTDVPDEMAQAIEDARSSVRV